MTNDRNALISALRHSLYRTHDKSDYCSGCAHAEDTLVKADRGPSVGVLDYDTLIRLEDFLDDYSDVKDGQDGPVPNRAMSLLQEVRKALDEGGSDGTVRTEDAVGGGHWGSLPTRAATSSEVDIRNTTVIADATRPTLSEADQRGRTVPSDAPSAVPAHYTDAFGSPHRRSAGEFAANGFCVCGRVWPCPMIPPTVAGPATTLPEPAAGQYDGSGAPALVVHGFCTCHLGSVCTGGCALGKHHGGCPGERNPAEPAPAATNDDGGGAPALTERARPWLRFDCPTCFRPAGSLCQSVQELRPFNASIPHASRLALAEAEVTDGLLNRLATALGCETPEQVDARRAAVNLNPLTNPGLHSEEASGMDAREFLTKRGGVE